jgi:hypothetical protein
MLQQNTFPTTAFADDDRDLVGIHGQIKMVQYDLSVKRLADVRKLDSQNITAVRK